MAGSLIGKEDIEALLRVTPETPENGQLLAQLIELRRESLIERRPYHANAVFAAVAAGATAAPVIVNIDAAAPFIITRQAFAANVAGAAQTYSTLIWPNMTVLLTLTGSSRQLMDVATPVTNIFGCGMDPYDLPEPLIIQANSSLQVTVTSFEAAASDLLRLTFSGYRLFALG